MCHEYAPATWRRVDITDGRPAVLRRTVHQIGAVPLRHGRAPRPASARAYSGRSESDSGHLSNRTPAVKPTRLPLRSEQRQTVSSGCSADSNSRGQPYRLMGN